MTESQDRGHAEHDVQAEPAGRMAALMVDV